MYQLENNRMIGIPDFKQLVKMFYAGGGTFFFVNSLTNQKFCLKLKRATDKKTKISYSEVHVCFNDGLYFHLGRYSFKYRIFQLSDETIGYNYERLKLFTESFKYVNERIMTGKDFPQNYKVHYNGACCRCGKQLEHPASLQKGIGGECEWLYEQEIKIIQLQLGL